jgi:uncharacterized protein (TIGR00299 family) protein
MKIAYLDCASGISGDMTLGALVDAGADLGAINAGIQTLGLPSVRLVANEVKKKGFRAIQITVEHEPEHKHRHLHHITAMIDGSPLTTRQKELAGRIFGKLAEAEAKVHGTTIQKVHFHEVGAVDSIADIVGAAIGFDLLGIERVESSSVPTGHGFVEIAHGRCAIPAPATGELLRGIPIAASSVEAELTTPTGAAILAALCERFGPPPAMTIDRFGYGAGQRELTEQPNLLRIMVGEATGVSTQTDQIVVLETNLDDISGELIGHAIARLWEAGALDVYTTPIQMKKQRPGVMLSVLGRPQEAKKLENVMLRETTTLGVRRYTASRTTLQREKLEVQTPWGAVQGVVAQVGDTARFSPEYESSRQIANQHNVPLKAVYDAAQANWAKQIND